jgi:RNA binding exosome subunit
MTTSGAVLSSKAPVGYVDVRVFAHATEDAEKVMTAIRNVLPSELVDTVVFRKTSLTGHHGNSITLIEARVKERKAVQAFFAELCSRLSIMDKQRLSDEIEQHLDRANLYLRLDKQSAFLNEMKLGSTDSIHLQIHFKKHGADEVLAVCRESGLLP